MFRAFRPLAILSVLSFPGTSQAATHVIDADTASALDFVSPKVGFSLTSLGLNPTIYSIGKSEDGGKTWSVKPLDDIEWPLMKFASESVGYVVGESGKVLKTVDGAESFTQHNTGAEGYAEFLEVVDEKHVWVVVSGVIYFSSDGAESWQRYDVERAEWVGSLTVQSLSFVDTRRGYMVTKDLGSAVVQLWETQDGGLDWKASEAALPTENPGWSMSSPEPGVIWTGSNAEALVSSSDFGASWNMHKLPDSWGSVYDIKFVNSNQGLVLTDQGLFATKDAGKTWAQDASVESYMYRRMDVLDAGLVWLLSRDGQVQASSF